MLQICYVIAKTAEEAERLWWEMPLSKVWALLHCELALMGHKVVYSSSLAEVKKYLRKIDDRNQGNKPAFEQNLDETKYIK